MPRPPFPPTIEARLTDDPIRARSDLPEGWVDLVLDLDTAIAGYDPDYVLVQVKEKFGGLRYYITHEHNEACGAADHSCAVFTAIGSAESLSYKTCEVCGAPGELRVHGWHRTLCDRHDQELSPHGSTIDP